MIFIIIGGIAGLYLGYRLWKDSYIDNSIGEIILSLILTVFFTAVGALCGGLVAAGVGSAFETEYVKSYTIDLVAMKDNSAVDGSFFLGTGRIDEEWYYVYYYKNQDESIEFDKIKADGVKIYEDGSENPRIDVCKQRFVKKSSIWFGLTGCGCDSGKRYRFHVPPNSITNEFKMDLE